MIIIAVFLISAFCLFLAVLLDDGEPGYIHDVFWAERRPMATRITLNPAAKAGGSLLAWGQGRSTFSCTDCWHWDGKCSIGYRGKAANCPAYLEKRETPVAGKR